MARARVWFAWVAAVGVVSSCGGSDGTGGGGTDGGGTDGGGTDGGGTDGGGTDGGGSSTGGAGAGGGGSAGAGTGGGAGTDGGGSGGAGTGGAAPGGGGSGGAGTGGAAPGGGGAGTGGGQTCCGGGLGCPCPPPGGGPGGGAAGCYSACVGDVCKHDYPSGGCWVDRDCGDRSCVGASVCPCGASCLVPDSVGRCEPAGGCCASDGDCGAGGARRCVEGVCQDAVEAPSCWLDGDCGPNERCLGRLLCACGDACYTTEHPGACGCCASANDCGDTYALTCAAGRCMDRRIAAGCWNDSMCPLGQTCEGERVCTCGAICLLPDAPGVCQ